MKLFTFFPCFSYSQLHNYSLLNKGKRVTLVEPLEVALDRRTVDTEPTGGLAFGDALPYRLYYVGAQIYRIGFHVSMMLDGATSLQAALYVAGAGTATPTGSSSG